MIVVCSYDRDRDDQSRVPTSSLNGSGANKIVRLAKPSYRKTRRHRQGNSAQLGRQSNSKRKEFDPKGPIEDIGPKERCHNALDNVVDEFFPVSMI